MKRRLKAASGQRKLTLSRTWAAQGRALLTQQFDQENGGFGFDPNNPRRPKFPQPSISTSSSINTAEALRARTRPIP